MKIFRAFIDAITRNTTYLVIYAAEYMLLHGLYPDINERTFFQLFLIYYSFAIFALYFQSIYKSVKK